MYDNGNHKRNSNRVGWITDSSREDILLSKPVNGMGIVFVLILPPKIAGRLVLREGPKDSSVGQIDSRELAFRLERRYLQPGS